MIDEDQGGHGLDHGHGAGEDTGVVATAAAQGGVLVVVIHGVLFMHDGGHGFEGDAEVDGFAVADAALDATGAIGGGADAVLDTAEGIIMGAAGEQDPGEAGADFEAFGGGQAEHGLGEVGFEAVEDWFAPTGGDAAGDAEDDTADAVALVAALFDALDHVCRDGGIGATDDIGFDLGGLEGVGVDGSDEVLDLGDAGEDLDVPEVAEEFTGDGAGGDPADGFAGAGAASAGPGADAEFGVVGVIGVGGPELGGHFGVGFGSEVFVADPEGEGGAESDAFEGAAEDLDGIGFFAGGGDGGLAWAPAVEVRLDIGFGERQSGGATVDDHADAAAMGFAPGGDAEEVAEGIAHGGRLPEGEGKRQAGGGGKAGAWRALTEGGSVGRVGQPDIVWWSWTMNEPGTTDEDRSWEEGGGEERWQFALEGSDLGVWDWNPKTGDVFFSERWLTMLGYRPEEIQPRLEEWSDRVHPEDLERVLFLISEHMEGRTAVYESEHRLRAKDGSWRWIQDRGKVLRRDEEGKPMRMVGTHLDITERKREEARLRRRTRQHEALGRLGREALAGGTLGDVFHTASVLVAESLEVEYCKVLQRDAEGKWLRLVAGVGWKDGCVGVATVEVEGGTQAAYTLGQREPVVMEDVATETRFRLPRLLEEHGVRSGISVVIEWRGRVWGLLGAHGSTPGVYTEDDRHFVQSVATLLSVVIERTTAEEALRAGDRRMREAQRIARLGDWEVDLKTGVLRWSEEVYRIFGVEPGHFGGTYEAFLEHVHPEDRERMRSEREKVIQGRGVEGFEVEHRVVGPGGRMIWVRERAEVVRDGSGRVVGLAGTVLDITDRKELLAQILRAQRMESVGTLAAGMAHDLNNVLAPILMSVELLALDEEEESRKEMLRSIEKSARRGAALVGQVLTFARGLEGRKVEVRLSQLVEEVMKIVGETFPRNIQAESQVEEGLWGLHADPTHLHQVLLNLCVNARDAMPGGGKLVVRAANVRLGKRDRENAMEAKEGPYVRVEVEDTGEGMTSAVLERIFDPFFTTKEVGKGTGLGLSTAMSIVKGHGGHFRVTSEPGKGSLFQIYLPALARSAAVEAETARVGLWRGRGEMVLVVDDEPMIRKVTQMTLESFGYRVVVGANGAEGLSVYQEHRGEVRLVVTDMMMPVMDGPALVGALLRLDPGLRIIATSGIAEGGPEWRSGELGIRHVLTKPFTTEALLETIRRALEVDQAGLG